MRTHITENEKSITHEHRRITWGKPQPKTPISVLSYKWKYVQVTKRINSQAILLSLQSNNTTHRLSKHKICLFLALQASYFLAQFFLGSNDATCVIGLITHSLNWRSNYAISKEWIPSACKRYSQWNIPTNYSTLSLHLISTGSPSELTCMNYLWENIQLSEVQKLHEYMH